MSNIATAIMEGLNMRQNTSNDLYGDYDFSATALAESSYMESACATLFTDIMEAEQAYMVADVVAAATIIHENTVGSEVDAIAVSEGVLKNGIERLKKAFQKFIVKVRDFYKKVIDWFKAMFSNTEDFVKNFGDKVKQKAGKVKGFSYKGYKYKVAAGDAAAEGYAKKISDVMRETVNGIDFASEVVSKAELVQKLGGKVSAAFDSDKATSATEVVDNWITKSGAPGGAENATELREELIKVYQDDETQKVEIKDFDGNSVDTMLKFMKDSSKKISTFQKQLSSFESHTDSIIKKLNAVKTPSGKEDDKGEQNIVSNCSYIASIMSGFLNLYKVPCNVQIDMYKAITKEWLGALKGFYNYKGNKESAEVFDTEAFAMLENDLILEGCKGGDCDPEDGDPAEEGCKKSTTEGCGKKATEGCTESVLQGILEAANSYI